MKKLLLLSILFLTGIIVFGQISSKEKDFEIIYNGNNLEFRFDYPVFVKASSGLLKREVLLSNMDVIGYNYAIFNVEPSSIIKLDYKPLSEDNVETRSAYIATPSRSTGTIDVFFNHPVDHSYSQGHDAINLANQLDDKLISYINECVSSLDIAIYNSYSQSSTTGIAGAINDAYGRGVQVRIIYDGSTGSTMLPLLNNSIPRLASPNNGSYGIMHNKFVIFDANNIDENKPLVWTGSTNWTLAQIDGPDKNSAIVIQDKTLALGYQIEFNEMWGSSTSTPIPFNSRFGPYKLDNTPHSYNIGGKIVNSYFSPSDGTTSKIIDVINSANTDINVATMLITRADISTALINRYSNGLISTQLIMDTQNPQGNQKALLQDAIGPGRVRTDTSKGVMHHKFMVVDNYNGLMNPAVLIGSHNWSGAAENKNDENTLVVYDSNVANQYYQAFAFLFKLSGGIITHPLSTFQNHVVENTYTIYPNPSHGIFNVRSEKVLATYHDLKVYDSTGKRISFQMWNGSKNESIDLSLHPSGIYYVVITNNNGVNHFKIIKK